MPKNNGQPTRRELRAARIQAYKDKHGLCGHLTTAGRPCKRAANPKYSKPGNPLCFTHSRTEEQRRILYQQAQATRKLNQLKPHELMRQVIESNPITFMQPYLDALGIRVVFVPDPNDPTILYPTAVADPASNGTTLYGVSKDGDVIISKHKDLEAQQRAAERLFDRVYGKPKQTNILATSSQQDDGNTIIPFDEKRQAEVAAILEAAQRPSHATHATHATQPTPNENSNN